MNTEELAPGTLLYTCELDGPPEPGLTPKELCVVWAVVVAEDGKRYAVMAEEYEKDGNCNVRMVDKYFQATPDEAVADEMERDIGYAEKLINGWNAWTDGRKEGDS